MSDEFRVLDGEIDLERDDVRDSRGRRIDADYVDRAVADVHARRGRRALGDETPAAGHSPQVSFRVPEQTRRKAEERARAEERSVSEVAREALERYLACATPRMPSLFTPTALPANPRSFPDRRFTMIEPRSAGSAGLSALS